MKNTITLLLIFSSAIILGCKDQAPKTLTVDDVLISRAKEDLLSKLKTPSTAVIIDSLSFVVIDEYTGKKFFGDYHVYLTCDSQNLFGAMVRREYMLGYDFEGVDSLNPNNYSLKKIF